MIDAAQYLTVYAGTAVRVEADDPRNSWTAIPTRPGAQPYSDAVEVLVPADGVEVMFWRAIDAAGCSAVQFILWWRVPSSQMGSGIHPACTYPVQCGSHSAGSDEFAAHDFPLDFIGLSQGGKVWPIPVLLNGMTAGTLILRGATFSIIC